MSQLLLKELPFKFPIFLLPILTLLQLKERLEFFQMQRRILQKCIIIYN